MNCSYENGPSEFIFSLKKGEGFLAKNIGAINTGIGSMSYMDTLPSHTVGLEIVEPNRAGYYWLLIHPDGNLISEDYSLLRKVAGNRYVHKGTCSTLSGQSPFILIRNQ